jgi:hypothetical protein
MTVSNDTADLYRYFDATPHAEYLYACVKETIDIDLRREVHFLGFYDEALKATQEIVDMPDTKAALLIKLIDQNGGRLSKSKRTQFQELTDDEVARIEEAIHQASERKTGG